jgi:hypothetical protein
MNNMSMRDELAGSTDISALLDKKEEEKNVDTKQEMEFSSPINDVMDTPGALPDIMAPQISAAPERSSGYPFNLKKNQVEAILAGLAGVIGFSEIVQDKISEFVPQAIGESGKLSTTGMVVMLGIIAIIFFFLKRVVMKTR